MIKKYPYLKDVDFLNKIYGQHNKTIYCNISSLDWQERCVMRVEGRVTNGSMSVNGDSAVRRTANISVKILNYDELYDNIDSMFAINKKIYLEIGLKNNLAHRGYYPTYPIIYFPFGVFLIQNQSVSYDSSGVTINLSLGDKMCLLNGTVSGVLPAAINFESVDTLGPDGDLHTEYIRINELIQEMVNHFGNEDLNKIFVNDIPNKIKQVMKWRGSNPLYLWSDKSDPRNALYTTINTQLDSNHYAKKTITFNYDAGYTYVDFVYPGELVASPGDTVCTVLDKLKQTLGNYEYYYDVFGNFIFQEIKNYVNVSKWRETDAYGQSTDDVLADSNAYLNYGYATRMNNTVYDFKNSEFIISYNNNPKFEMIKNDFVVWGERKNASGIKLPCRYHLVIDERPKLLEDWDVTVDGRYICFDLNLNDKIKRANVIKGSYDSFDSLKEAHPLGIVGEYYRIGNDVYSWISDIENYTNMLNNYVSSGEGLAGSINIQVENTNTSNAGYIKMPLATVYGANTVKGHFVLPTTTNWRNILYYQGLLDAQNGLGTNYYWAEMCNEWPKLYDVEKHVVSDPSQDPEGHDPSNPDNDWIDGALDIPTSFDWWIDFIDNDSVLNKFCVNNIGRRSYSKTDTSCNCVFEPDIPAIVMVNCDDTGEDTWSQMTQDALRELGLTPVQVSNAIYDSMATGGTFNSCYQHVRQILTDYTNYNEDISFSCLPIYHLEPNTRISLNCPDVGIYGDYIINSISFDLSNSGTMNISAKKCIEKI